MIHGKSEEVLKRFPDNYFHSTVTDPPYELTSIRDRFGKTGSAPANFAEDGSFSRLSKGFQGKTWDGTGIALDPSFWAQVLRVQRPGSFLAAFGGRRTAHRMFSAIEDAGFEITESIDWIYGQGFSKGVNIEKAMYKVSGDSVRSSIHSGYNTLLKPSHEPICIARKELDEIDSGELYSLTGWDYWTTRKIRTSRKDLERYTALGYEPIFSSLPNDDTLYEGEEEKEREDNARVAGGIAAHFVVENKKALHPLVESKILLHHKNGISEIETHPYRKWKTVNVVANYLKWGVGGMNIGESRIGGSRWPATTLLTHSINCQRIGEEVVKGYTINRFDNGMKPFGNGAGERYTSYKDNGGNGGNGGNGNNGTVEVWNCADDCPVKHMDSMTDNKASLYFKTFGWDLNVGFPFIYSKKVSPGERKLPDGSFHKHPTAKPEQLLSYLVRLLTPHGGIVLDPFAGSGSCGSASAIQGMGYVGVEMEEEYYNTSVIRLSPYMEADYVI